MKDGAAGGKAGRRRPGDRSLARSPERGARHGRGPQRTRREGGRQSGAGYCQAGPGAKLGYSARLRRGSRDVKGMRDISRFAAGCFGMCRTADRD